MLLLNKILGILKPINALVEIVQVLAELLPMHKYWLAVFPGKQGAWDGLAGRRGRCPLAISAWMWTSCRPDLPAPVGLSLAVLQAKF